MIDWANFHFLRPEWLSALVLLIPLCWAGLRARRSGGLWRGICDAHLLRHLITDGGGRQRHWPLVLMALAWTTACLAMAGPAWEPLPLPAYRSPEQRVLVLNLAPSMNATDVRPSRLDRARHKVKDALDAMGGSQVGLVIFNEEPYVVSPIADDPRVVAEFLPILETGLMPGRGARVDRAIEHASALLEQAGATRGGIVLVTDSAGDEPAAALRAAKKAAAAGYSVSVLGIGTEEGAPVPTSRGFLRDAGGRAVMARLETEALTAIADAGKGRFARMSADDRDVEAVLGLATTPLDATASFEASGLKTDVWKDMGIVLVWMLALLAPLAFRRGWAASIGLVFAVGTVAMPSSNAQASVQDWMWRADQRGAQAFEAGHNDEAAGLFEDPDWRAAALYRDGRYDEAAALLGESSAPAADYNLGNALARSGRLEEALAAYDRILEAQPEQADARHNRDLVAKLLEQQQQEQEEEDQPQQSGESDESAQGDESTQGDESRSSDGDPSESGSAEEQNEGESKSDQSSEPDASGESNSPGSAASSNSQEPDASGEDGGRRGEEESQQASSSAGASEASDDGQQTGEAGSDADTSQPASSSLPRPVAADPGEEVEGPSRSSMASEPLSERDQAVERWLNRLDDDPGGLLREKLRRRYAQRRYLEQVEELNRMGGRIR
jgi:Ca-activated chloride channel family protein